MSTRIFTVEEGSIQERFFQCRSKIQIYAGGFANGKTSGACVKALDIARAYPGSNILIARATYPKLNDTIRKEIYKWCPETWIKRMPTKDDNTMVLTNGTTINFRYIAQQGRSNPEGTTSNLLSATYDLVVVDQIEDPEIGEKDFDDLLGRLRGSTRYVGDDTTMPRTGPRWMFITCNPTANWFYKKAIRPIHRSVDGHRDPDLMVNPRTKEVMIELFEGSTYANKRNLASDYIEGLEAAYTGQMRKRFLLGEWGAYEGLIYSMFDVQQHSIPHELLTGYIRTLRVNGFRPVFHAGYDYGMAVQSTYILSFVDPYGNMFMLDGFYEKEVDIDWQAREIRAINREYGAKDILAFADPSIFRRSAGQKKIVGKTIADMFREEGVYLKRGNNDIINGITKVQGYLNIQKHHRNPITQEFGAPHLYVSDRLEFWIDEVGAYYWKRNPQNDIIDKPIDKDDHAMDATKYMLTKSPVIGKIVTRGLATPVYMRWAEADLEPTRSRRYG